MTAGPGGGNTYKESDVDTNYDRKSTHEARTGLFLAPQGDAITDQATDSGARHCIRTKHGFWLRARPAMFF
jgi:hypothetical protein